MEKKEVRIDDFVTVAGITLIPVVQVSRNYWCGDSVISFFGVKQPVSIVVVSPSVKKAFRLTGEEVPLDQFIQEVPDIEEILEGL